MDRNLTHEENGSQGITEELSNLLQEVSDKGIEALTINELDKLRTLLEAKDYGDNKKAIKSKRKLLKKINSAMYDKYNKRRRAFL